ncbi:unnamed protein product [Urochloa decumbens]|uniref:Uncharacterized protein n=1 Tax=Urochloa decumbens TaxID=240449 RepID=A0ABC9E6R0_9POAL
MRCHVWSSPPLSVARPATLPILPVGHLPGLRLRTRLAAVRAQKPGGDDPPHNFAKEKSHISSQFGKVCRIREGLLYDDSRNISQYLIIRAKDAVQLASHIVDSARLMNVTVPNEIPADTIHRTLQAYAETFTHTADDAYNRTVSINTITLFLGALRGLASVTHILLEAALETLSHQHPRESLLEYAFNRDVKIMHREYNRRMDELQEDYQYVPAASDIHEVLVIQTLRQTIRHGMNATESIVQLMMARRERALGKYHTEREKALGMEA